MGSPFLGIAAGLSQGLAQGIQTGANLATQKQQLAIQQTQAASASLTALNNVLKITDPAFRTLGINKVLPGLGIDPNTPDGKQLVKSLVTANDESISKIQTGLEQFGMQYTPEMIGRIYNEDPTYFATMLANLVAKKQGAEIVAGVMDPNAPSSSTGSGDMGAGAPGAGGGSTAPSGGAGTPDASVQPGAPSPAPTTPAQGVSDDNRGVSQVGTGTTKLGIAQNGSPLRWSPGGDPYVGRLNLAMVRAQALPEPESTKVIAQIKDLRDTYIAGRKIETDNYVAQLHLDLEAKRITIDQYNAALARERLTHDENMPLSDIGKYYHDANLNLLQLNNGKPLTSGTFPTSDAAGTSSGLGDKNFKTTEVSIPDSIRGKDPTANGGIVNSDGTITIQDQGLLNALKVGDESRAVFDPKSGKIFLQSPTNSSLQTPSNLDEARVGLNGMQTGLNTVDKLIQYTLDAPKDIGIAGSVRGMVQNIASQAQDLAKLIPYAQPLLKKVGLPDNYFDPKITEIESSSHVLNALVTNALAASGKGLNSFSTLFKDTATLTDLTGFKSLDQVKAKLSVIRDILEVGKQSYQSQLPTGSVSGVPEEKPKIVIPPKPVAQTQPAAPAPAPAVENQPNPAKMTPEQKAAVVDTKNDHNASIFPVLPGGTSHLKNIPNGDIINLKNSLKSFTRKIDQRQLKDWFDHLYGHGAAASVGYP